MALQSPQEFYRGKDLCLMRRGLLPSNTSPTVSYRTWQAEGEAEVGMGAGVEVLGGVETRE